MSAQFWLVKTEPEEYSLADLERAEIGCWDGVRNLEARNNLRAMQPGDRVLIYHTGKERTVVGEAQVHKAAYRDPTSNRAIWSAVDLQFVRALSSPVTLKTIKTHGGFESCALVRRSRLSVMPIEAAHFELILELSQTQK